MCDEAGTDLDQRRIERAVDDEPGVGRDERHPLRAAGRITATSGNGRSAQPRDR